MFPGRSTPGDFPTQGTSSVGWNRGVDFRGETGESSANANTFFAQAAGGGIAATSLQAQGGGVLSSHSNSRPSNVQSAASLLQDWMTIEDCLRAPCCGCVCRHLRMFPCTHVICASCFAQGYDEASGMVTCVLCFSRFESKSALKVHPLNAILEVFHSNPQLRPLIVQTLRGLADEEARGSSHTGPLTQLQTQQQTRSHQATASASAEMDPGGVPARHPSTGHSPSPFPPSAASPSAAWVEGNGNSSSHHQRFPFPPLPGPVPGMQTQIHDVDQNLAPQSVPTPLTFSSRQGGPVGGTSVGSVFPPPGFESRGPQQQQQASAQNQEQVVPVPPLQQATGGLAPPSSIPLHGVNWQPQHPSSYHPHRSAREEIAPPPAHTALTHSRWGPSDPPLLPGMQVMPVGGVPLPLSSCSPPEIIETQTPQQQQGHQAIQVDPAGGGGTSSSSSSAAQYPQTGVMVQHQLQHPPSASTSGYPPMHPPRSYPSNPISGAPHHPATQVALPTIPQVPAAAAPAALMGGQSQSQSTAVPPQTQQQQQQQHASLPPGLGEGPPELRHTDPMPYPVLPQQQQLQTGAGTPSYPLALPPTAHAFPHVENGSTDTVSGLPSASVPLHAYSSPHPTAFQALPGNPPAVPTPAGCSGFSDPVATVGLQQPPPPSSYAGGAGGSRVNMNSTATPPPTYATCSIHFQAPTSASAAGVFASLPAAAAEDPPRVAYPPPTALALSQAGGSLPLFAAPCSHSHSQQIAPHAPQQGAGRSLSRSSSGNPQQYSQVSAGGGTQQQTRGPAGGVHHRIAAAAASGGLSQMPIPASPFPPRQFIIGRGEGESGAVQSQQPAEPERASAFPLPPGLGERVHGGAGAGPGNVAAGRGRGRGSPPVSSSSDFLFVPPQSGQQQQQRGGGPVRRDRGGKGGGDTLRGGAEPGLGSVSASSSAVSAGGRVGLGDPLAEAREREREKGDADEDITFGPPGCNVFICDLPRWASEEDIRALMERRLASGPSSAGDGEAAEGGDAAVVSVSLYRHANGRSKNTGIVVLSSPEIALQAIREVTGTEMKLAPSDSRYTRDPEPPSKKITILPRKREIGVLLSHFPPGTVDDIAALRLSRKHNE
uniref:RRM domain-containing protein n=1 Tax=Chromera velia CCMP2878 TaxID=1169474 RepID=A0A0G4GTB2_9ALVE|eukprot:Cvel_5158.t1-p1 / transcript=Cvel_5158.t1 / gene=Cvel_5158 / organism=Chromera_velia_CCMP2878 / gene_product=hypothetical protein / transcript_product=hypothetical protein / location=Cvel_scaffold236:91682-97447(+) / protein_length=1107 / sequence_SO=supercontig / SO=protein_coding / is_pseudo=false